jgi:hypothetical protein
MGDNTAPTDTLYIGNLDQRVTTRILYDLCIQVGSAQVLMYDAKVYCHPCQYVYITSTRLCKEPYTITCRYNPSSEAICHHVYPGVNKKYAFCQYQSMVGHFRRHPGRSSEHATIC